MTDQNYELIAQAKKQPIRWGRMSFSSLHWDILISTFKKIPWPFSNCPPCKTFEVRNCENMENTLKINVFERSILFCKYLDNESSDPYEFLFGSQLISCKLKYQILWRSVHKCGCTSCKHERAHFIASACVYESCARYCARIFMKFKT